MKILKILLILITAELFPQTIDSVLTERVEHPVVIDSIIITGNNITEEDIILRELNFGIGDTVTTEILKYNKERIYSLGIFNRVNLYVEETYSRDLIIDVEESWYIYPLPFIELRDRDWKKVAYGLDVTIRNFRGRNETLRGRVSFGYNPNYYLVYNVPSLLNDRKYFFSTEFFYRTNRNPSSIAKFLYGSDFDQKFIGGYINVGRRFGLYHRLSLSSGYVYVESPKYINGISISGTRIDRLISTNLNYSYDTRDLSQFPKNGIFFGASVGERGYGLNGIDFQTLNLDFREYRKIFGDLIGKWRTASRFTFGRIPFYEFSYLGLGEKIRGHFYEQREGHQMYIASVELTYPIIKDLNIRLDFIPILPNELLHYRVALYTQAFADAGAVQFRREPFSIKNFDSGYGAGFTLLILPYNVLRFEFALNEQQDLEWIFDLGVSF